MVDACYNQMPAYTVDKFRSGLLDAPLYSEEAAAQPQHALIGSAVNAVAEPAEKVKMMVHHLPDGDRTSSSRLNLVTVVAPANRAKPIEPRRNGGGKRLRKWARRKSSPTIPADGYLDVSHKMSVVSQPSPRSKVTVCSTDSSDALSQSQWYRIDGAPPSAISLGNYVNGNLQMLDRVKES